MYIKRISLRNYRIYNEENTLTFPKKASKNVFIVSGNNGYGKTTLLTSLVWGLYGKLMVDVDDKFRREIYEAGGYKKYSLNNFNRKAKVNYGEFQVKNSEYRFSELKSKSITLFNELSEKAKHLRSYSVSLLITDLHIPAIPCNDIEIIRTFDTEKGEDYVQILIDGKENELTKQVGDEIFINDFILPKEIAKFFFFDAEKIVALAEIKSLEEKRSLSKAYSEVLGIKKYEDLKSNLEDLRIRVRRNSASENDKVKLLELQKEVNQLKKLVEHNQQQLTHWQGEKGVNRQLSEQLQEKLIREGNTLTISELTDLKGVREKLTNEANAIKNKIKDFLDIAPFAIAGQLFSKVKGQSDKELEKESKALNPELLKKKFVRIYKEFKKDLKKQKINPIDSKKLISALENTLSKNLIGNKDKETFRILLAFNENESNEFNAIYNNLKFSFSVSFRQLIKEYKNNRVFFNKVVRKISQAETKENDLLIKEIRQNKNEADENLIDIEAKVTELNQEIGGHNKEIAIKSKVLSELTKKVELEESDRAKDEVAERLISELEQFIQSFKLEKKHSLEEKIKKELNLLMHKRNFIHRVEVLIEADIIDINLFDKRNEVINKESLSKGEQQLYATSLLKALVDESNIKFPVFIDSPLQKFDKKHSINIIKDFYPKISEQVVLFPLLEKELSEGEFETLLPKVNKSYLIKNVNEDCSTFSEIEPKQLFKLYKKEFADVYNN